MIRSCVRARIFATMVTVGMWMTANAVADERGGNRADNKPAPVTDSPPRTTEDMREALADADVAVRISALTSLAKSRGMPDEAVPVAAALLDHALPQVRKAGIILLELYGPLAADAFGPLVRVAETDPDADVKETAGRALATIDPWAMDIARGVYVALHRGESALPETIVSRVRQARVELPVTLVLIEIIRHDEMVVVKARAVTLLATLGPTAQAALPDLRQLMSHEELKVFAAVALAVIAPPEIETRLNDLVAATEPRHPFRIRAIAAAVLARRTDAFGTQGVEVLKALAEDPTEPLRWMAAQGLAQAAPKRAASVVPVLVEVVADSDASQASRRWYAIDALAHIGHGAGPAVDTLVAALDDDDPSIRERAAGALGAIGLNPEKVVPKLAARLTVDRTIDVRNAAARSIGQFGSDAAIAIKQMEAALSRPGEHPSVLATIITAIGEVGPKESVKLLAGLLGHSDVTVRRRVLRSLDELGSEAWEAVPELRAVLKATGDSNVAFTLSRIGPNASLAIPELVEVLQGAESFYSRRQAADALARVSNGEQEVINALSVALGDHDARVGTAAAYSLGYIGDSAHSAVDALLKIVTNEASPEVLREAAIYALGQIGPASKTAVDTLVQLLQSSNLPLRRRAATALGQIGDASDSVSATLRDAATAKDDRIVRHNAIIALGRLGAPNSRTIETLTECVADRDHRPMRIRGAIALGDLAVKAESRELLASLTKARDQLMEACSSGKVPGDLPSVSRAKERLDLAIARLSSPRAYQRAWQWCIASPVRWGPLAYASCVIFLCGSLYVVRPLGILHVDRFLNDNTDVIGFAAKLLGKEFSAGLSLSPALGIRFLRYRPRVLDAWVAEKIDVARSRFESLSTVEKRRIRVKSRFRFNDASVTVVEPTVEMLRPLFIGAKSFVVIEGDGGTGKTNLAVQLAEWAMNPAPESRLRVAHVMIPILIEGDLDPVNPPNDSLMPTIVRKLTDLCALTESPAPEFVRQLLRTGRLLLICDGVSEMPKDNREVVSPLHLANLGAAIVATGRRIPEAKTVVHHTIEVCNLTGADVQRFLAQYLDTVAPRLFKSSQIATEAGRLIAAMGERPLPAIIVRFFGDVVAQQAKTGDGESPIKGCFDLIRLHMSSLLRQCNRTELPANSHTLTDRLETLAWNCVQDGYRPTSLSVADAVRIVGDDASLAFAMNKLKVLQATHDGSRIAFVMDPVAESLGAGHHVRLLGTAGENWNQLFQKIDKVDGAPVSVRGFMTAVQDAVICLGRYDSLTAQVRKDLEERIKCKNG